METRAAVDSLAALAQPSRLAIYRALVQAGPQGQPAGAIAAALGLPPATLSFHLAQLAHAGLVHRRQQG
ncbi:MAG: helix-turn-helix domain-containing protein, partial [bacterium]